MGLYGSSEQGRIVRIRFEPLCGRTYNSLAFSGNFAPMNAKTSGSYSVTRLRLDSLASVALDGERISRAITPCGLSDCSGRGSGQWHGTAPHLVRLCSRRTSGALQEWTAPPRPMLQAPARGMSMSRALVPTGRGFLNAPPIPAAIRRTVAAGDYCLGERAISGFELVGLLFAYPAVH